MLAVFIIENETPLLRLLGWALLEEGLKVARATSLPDALSRLPDARTDWLIVNASLGADELREYIVELRAAAQTPIVVLRPAQVTEDVGADAYIEAPYRVDDLCRSIGAS